VSGNGYQSLTTTSLSLIWTDQLTLTIVTVTPTSATESNDDAVARQLKADKDAESTPTKKAKSRKINATTPTTAPEGETQREKLIRLRALQIEIQAELKKASDEVSKSQSPAMKKATKEVARAEDRTMKALRETHERELRAKVLGCSPGTVIVHPAAVGGPRFIVHSTMIVYNDNLQQIPVTIRSGNKIAVENLGAGCSMTLVKSVDMVMDAGYTVVSYSAEGRDSVGRLWTSQPSPQTTLQVCQGYPCQVEWRLPDWHIKLQ
jgi:hypothetical protein